MCFTLISHILTSNHIEMKKNPIFSFLLFTVLLLSFSSFTFAETYYVSSSGGQDKFDGLTGTRTKGNHGPLKHCPGMASYTGSVRLIPGDVVVFKRGDIWTENFIASVPGVTYTSKDGYGKGDACFDLGTGDSGLNYGISIEASHVTVSHLKFTNGKPIITSLDCPDHSDIRPCSPILDYRDSDLAKAAIIIAPPGITVGGGYLISDWPACIMGVNSSGVSERLTRILVDHCKFIDTYLGAVSIRFTNNSTISNNIYGCSDLGNCCPSPTVSAIYYGSGTEYIIISGNDISGVTGIHAIAGSQAWGFVHSEMRSGSIFVTPSYVCTDCGKNYYYEYENYETQFPRYILIEKNIIHDCWSIGIMAVGEYVTVQYNEIFNMNKTESPVFSPPVDGKNGVAGFGNYILGGSCLYNSNIRYNKVYDTYFWIKFPDCNGYPWTPCNEGDAIYLEFACWDNNWYGNVLFNNGKGGLHQVYTGRNHFYHNSLYHNGYKRFWAADCCNAPVSSYTNNLFVDNGAPPDRTAILIDGTRMNYDISVINNLFYDFNDVTESGKHIGIKEIMWRGKTENFSLSEFEAHALKNPSLICKAVNNKWINPMYVNPSYLSAECDLQLQEGSPAIDAGGNAPANYKVDFPGNPIYGPPDIGAYEYQPPYTMGVDKLNIEAGIRVYGDEKFRNLSTPGALTANLSVSIEGSDKIKWLDIKISEWQISGNYKKAWTESTDINPGNTMHVAGDLKKNTYYIVKVNNIPGWYITGTECNKGICLSDDSGMITFTYTGDYSSPREFVIEESDKILSLIQ